jgi:hypothetical protein
MTCQGWNSFEQKMCLRRCCSMKCCWKLYWVTADVGCKLKIRDAWRTKGLIEYLAARRSKRPTFRSHEWPCSREPRPPPHPQMAFPAASSSPRQLNLISKNNALSFGFNVSDFLALSTLMTLLYGWFRNAPSELSWDQSVCRGRCRLVTVGKTTQV